MATHSATEIGIPHAETDLQKAARIQSLDILRGLIMVLMAIDHVRVYSGVPPGGPEAGVFFTRWITHFCAPGFAFFAGTSAFLYGIKIKDKAALSKYLLTRGLLLVVLELTVIRFLWEFNLNYSEFTLFGVIWMLGWCMVGMAGLVYLKPATVGIIGLAIVFLQQIFSYVPGILPSPTDASFGRVWEFIYSSDYQTFDGIAILYVIVPWIGVMAAGYGFGVIMQMNPERRNRICMIIGASSIALFIVIGSIILLRNPSDEMPFLFQLLNQRKYPASQLYLMMTLGPLILMIPFAEKAKGWLASMFTVFGRVPFFYYLMHILLIHLSAIVVQLITNGQMNHEWFAYAPFTQVPEEFRWPLPLLYLVFLADVGILYVVCRWYLNFKNQNPQIGWLKYL
jgi:uncharacterized membrane protein